MWPFVSGFFHLSMCHVFKVHPVVACVSASFLFCDQVTVLCTLQWAFGLFPLLAPMITLLWTFVYKFLFGRVFSFLLGVYLCGVRQ